MIKELAKNLESIMILFRNNSYQAKIKMWIIKAFFHKNVNGLYKVYKN